MLRLTGPQIAAAMALLGWNQPEVIEASGLHRNTVGRAIKDTSKTDDGTLTTLRRTFEARGIRFLPDEGVKKHYGSVDRLEGADALYRFFDDVYDTVKDGGDLCVSSVDERLFAKYNINEEAAQHHRSRMSAIKDKIKFRVLLKEGDTYFRNNSYIEYRWIQKEFFDEHPVYVYNNKLAFIDFGKGNLEITIIDMPKMAKAFRLQFDFMWGHSLTPKQMSES